MKYLGLIRDQLHVVKAHRNGSNESESCTEKAVELIPLAGLQPNPPAYLLGFNLYQWHIDSLF